MSMAGFSPARLRTKEAVWLQLPKEVLKATDEREGNPYRSGLAAESFQALAGSAGTASTTAITAEIKAEDPVSSRGKILSWAF
jgi:hypothetical protein